MLLNICCSSRSSLAEILFEDFFYLILFCLKFIIIHYHSHIKAKKLKRSIYSISCVFPPLRSLQCVVVDKNKGEKGPDLLPCKTVKQFYQLNNEYHLF